MSNSGRHSHDEEIFLRIKKGDPVALKKLFDTYYSGLCYFSFQFLKSKDLAQEAVSDVFLNIWLKRETIVITGKIKPYLYSAVRNQSINYLKKNNQEHQRVEPGFSGANIFYMDTGLNIEQSELENYVEKVLQKLPEKRQLIFRMSRVDGLSYAEIAEILKISVNTVQNQMVKAVKFMKEQYPALKKLLFLIISI